MSWFKIDDQFPTHPKVLRAGPEAAWLFVAGGCYCAKHLTDGLIPKCAVATLTNLRGASRLASRLVNVGLWHERAEDYEVHDYLDYNPTREQVEEDRRKARARRTNGGKRSGERRANVTNPDPTRPEVLSEPLGDAAVAAPDPRVGQLIAGYVDDYRIVSNGRDPDREWRGAAGKAIQRALRNGEEPEDVARCLGVCASEGKNPSTLANVLADYHAGRERRART